MLQKATTGTEKKEIRQQSRATFSVTGFRKRNKETEKGGRKVTAVRHDRRVRLWQLRKV